VVAIISRLDLKETVEAKDAEISRLQAVCSLLADHVAPLKPPKSRKVSAEVRKDLGSRQGPELEETL
jgi:hypothetical protein